MKIKPERLTIPDVPEPASYGLTKFYYPDKITIIKKIKKMLKIKVKKLPKKNIDHHDVPGKWFKGPF